MRLHADLTLPARVVATELDWVPSPMPGVERRRLARVGDEVARVTSLVRYAPGSRFKPHVHGGGEEFLVLEGTFSDEFGDHPEGTWVRNGVGSSHAPRTEQGCVILVKLWWMHPHETGSSRIDTLSASWLGGEAHRTLPLYEGPHDRTDLHALEPGAELSPSARGGLELFVITGGREIDGVPLPRWGWLRVPGPEPVRIHATQASTIYVKRGHLADPPPLPV